MFDRVLSTPVDHAFWKNYKQLKEKTKFKVKNNNYFIDFKTKLKHLGN